MTNKDGRLAERNKRPSFDYSSQSVILPFGDKTLRIMTTDERYMMRCLQLAKNGMQNAKPNPMVGAVIVSGGRIIGEGYHVCCGEGHAEVNAFASVKAADEHLLKEATIYVSLEPCSHYGKTPPCADLIIRKGVKRAVVGCVDPFAKVHGNGIRKLREAGIEVTVGVLEEECNELNKRFFAFHRLKRPYILLKWCQTANGFLDDCNKPLRMSTPYTQMLVHKLRSEYDAILVGRVTAERDKPKLNVRLWAGNDPKRIVIDREHPCFDGLCFDNGDTVPGQIAGWLHGQGVQSLMVEGGAETLKGFLRAGLFDEIRVETAPVVVDGGKAAPMLAGEELRFTGREVYGQNVIDTYHRIG